MKAKVILFSTLGLLFGSLHAQTFVPAHISYQGRVADSSGAGLGTGAPVNRKVIFRLFDASVGGNRLWTEEQTVTFSNGEFSVLLGNGTTATGTAAGESRPALDTVFTTGSTERYLQITVDNGDNTITAADQPISPRQRMTSTAYTFRARAAESVVTGQDLLMNDSANHGLGWYGSGRPFNGATINGPVLFGQGGGALGTKNGAAQTTAMTWTASGVAFPQTVTFSQGMSGNGSGLTSLNASQLSSGTVPPSLIPGLDASKITSGVFDLNRMPTLDNAKITSLDASKLFGTMPTGVIPTLDINSKVSGSLDISSRTTGTLPDNRLSSNVALLNRGGQTFGGTNFFQGEVHASLGMSARALDLAWFGGTPFLDFSRNNADYNARIILHGNHLSFECEKFAFQGPVDVYSGLWVQNNLIINSRVGIGTQSPNSPLHVVGTGDNISYTDRSTMNAVGFHDDANVGYANAASIYASGMIMSPAFIAYSDERTKKIQGVSSGDIDLLTLMRIQVTNYEHHDYIAKGKSPQKKVIAQQVEQVFPQAVSKSVDVIPDIYQLATHKDGWVLLKTDLKVGERVRLISGQSQEVYEVLEIDENHSKFRTGFITNAADVFVYGREVKDFRSVDYDAISMLNVSATQQIKKEKDAEVQALQAETAALRARIATQQKEIAALRAADKARDAKLAAIEKLLLSPDKPSARPVSLKRGDGAE